MEEWEDRTLTIHDLEIFVCPFSNAAGISEYVYIKPGDMIIIWVALRGDE